MKHEIHLHDDNDPIGVLDVTILTNQVLAPFLDIEDLRRSKRIDFVGGIRGLGELSRRVDNGEMVAAFALLAVRYQQSGGQSHRGAGECAADVRVVGAAGATAE